MFGIICFKNNERTTKTTFIFSLFIRKYRTHELTFHLFKNIYLPLEEQLNLVQKCYSETTRVKLTNEMRDDIFSRDKPQKIKKTEMARYNNMKK